MNTREVQAGGAGCCAGLDAVCLDSLVSFPPASFSFSTNPKSVSAASDVCSEIPQTAQGRAQSRFSLSRGS